METTLEQSLPTEGMHPHKVKLLDLCMGIQEAEKPFVTDQHPSWLTLWRVSSGDKARAIETVKTLVSRYSNLWEKDGYKDFEMDLDSYLAERFGSGCEIEWLS
jgi:hypothetical protein